MPTLLLSTHTYASIFFSIYGTLHVLHHFLAATIMDPEWHIQIQDRFMPRSIIGEKIMILVPAFLTLISGWMLLYKNRKQLIRSVFETGQLALPFFGLGKKIFGDNFAKTSSDEKVIQLSKFRRVQYFSALLLGICLWKGGGLA